MADFDFGSFISDTTSGLTDTANLVKYTVAVGGAAAVKQLGTSTDLKINGQTVGSLTLGGVNNTTLLLIAVVVLLVWSA